MSSLISMSKQEINYLEDLKVEEDQPTGADNFATPSIMSGCSTWSTNNTEQELEDTSSKLEETRQLVGDYEEIGDQMTDKNALRLIRGCTKAGETTIIKQDSLCIENIKVEDGQEVSNVSPIVPGACSLDMWLTNDKSVSEQTLFTGTGQDKVNVNGFYLNDVVRGVPDYDTEGLGSPSIKQETICIEDVKIEDKDDASDDLLTHVTDESSESSLISDNPLLKHAYSILEGGKLPVGNHCGESTEQTADFLNINGGVQKCSFCDYTTKRTSTLHKHFSVKHDPTTKVYKCATCSYETKYACHYRTHLKSRYNKCSKLKRGDTTKVEEDTRTLYKCNYCEYSTKIKSTWYKHVQVKHSPNAKVFKCGECYYETKDKSNLYKHIKGIHNKRKKGKVEVTTSISEEAKVPSDHQHEATKAQIDNIGVVDQQSISGVKPGGTQSTDIPTTTCKETRKCEHCEYTGESKNRLLKHTKSKRKVDGDECTNKCTFCDNSYKWAASLFKHIRAKHSFDDKVHKCKLCDYTRKSLFSLNTHIRTMHNPNAKVYNCFELPQSKVELLESAVDLPEGPVDLPEAAQRECKYCEYTAETNEQMVQHFESNHTGFDGVYECTFCNYTCKWMVLLWEHINEEHDPNAKVYKCKLCGQTSKTIFLLNQHINAEHATVYKCTFCDYTCKCYTTLQKHLDVKHNPNTKVHKCMLCDYTTNKMSILHKHVSVMHNRNAQIYKCAVGDYETQNGSDICQHFTTKHDKSDSCVLGHLTSTPEEDKPSANSHATSPLEAKLGVSDRTTESVGDSAVSSHYEPYKEREDTKSNFLQTTESMHKHKCGYCAYTTDSEYHLVEHTDLNHSADSDIYKCAFCHYTYKLISSLRKHVNTVHNPDTELLY